MPQPLNLASGGSGTLLVRRQTRTLLHACPGSVVLKVEHVLHVPGQRSHLGMEVRALGDRYSLKTLLPYGVLLISKWEKRDRQCCSSGEVVLAQGGESDVHHQLNAGVGLVTNDGPRPRLRGVEGCRCHGQSAMVDWSIPVVAKTDECVI
jgi:hypothetical protein